MFRFPFKGVGIGCTVMTVLVIARCLATIGRARYYGYTNWNATILADPWFYVGMCAAVIGIGCLITLLVQERKNSRR